MTALARHDMVLLTAQGVGMARSAAREYNPHLLQPQIDALLAPGVPGIVRRQEQPRPDAIELGFSSPYKEDGVRLRAASAVPLFCIERVMTPFDAMALAARADAKPRAVLDALRRAGELCGIEIGVYGSLALWLVSGLPYFTTDSDYDIYARKTAADADAKGFYERSRQLAQREQVRIDIEIDCGGGFAAKLAELYSGQKTVLCKGLYAVELRRLNDAENPGGDA